LILYFLDLQCIKQKEKSTEEMLRSTITLHCTGKWSGHTITYFTTTPPTLHWNLQRKCFSLTRPRSAFFFLKHYWRCEITNICYPHLPPPAIRRKNVHSHHHQVSTASSPVAIPFRAAPFREIRSPERQASLPPFCTATRCNRTETRIISFLDPICFPAVLMQRN
jgi:hypothetical protein